MSETPTGTDRVELTEDEREQLDTGSALFGWGTREDALSELVAVVESIVAARVQALTAERDDAKRRSLHAMNQRDEERRMKEGNITALNKVSAELAAANARCAELEAAVEQEITTRDQYADLLDRFAAAIPGDHGEHSSGNDPWTNALASAAALQATLDRVTAVVAGWEATDDSPVRYGPIRAALTPEGKP